MTGAMPAIVLVVDDSTVLPALAQMAAHGRLPYPVYACACGAEALSYIDQGGVGCVIADDRVPDMDGLALAQAINARWPAVRVALLATQATTDLYDAAQTAGCVAVISKPVGSATLHAVVNALLSAHGREVPRRQGVGQG